ncbi:MAG: flagellar hook capping protein [Desulfitobacterium sp.]|nr:flagellar hook capping protein [Desulfitobacterium sp.]
MSNNIDTQYRNYNYPSAAGSSKDKDDTVSSAANDILGKDAFLQLLVAELTNQDPLSPMDNKDMVTQMAQFSTVEQLTNIYSSMDNLSQGLSSIFQHSLLTQGAALIGKQVSGMIPGGEEGEPIVVEGIVEAVQWLDGHPQLTLRLADGNLVALDMNQILTVTEPIVSEPEEEGEGEGDGKGGKIDGEDGNDIPEQDDGTGEPVNPTVPDTGDDDSDYQKFV